MGKAAHYQSHTSQSSNRGLKIAGIVCGALLAVLMSIYIAGCIYFSGKLWPNTFANGVDLSLMSQAQAKDALDARSEHTKVSVSGMGLHFTVDANAAGVKSNSEAAASAMSDKVNPLLWPISILLSHDMSMVVFTTFDTAAVMATVNQEVEASNKDAVAPTDASMQFDAATNAFVIDPGSRGTMVDAGRVTQKVVQAFLTDSPVVNVNTTDLIGQSITRDDPLLVAACDTANSYLACNLDFTLNGAVVATLNPTVVKDWVVIADDFSVSLDDQKLVDFAAQIENDVDDTDKTRTYTRPDGKQVSVTGGTYGWVTNGDIVLAMVRDTVANGYTGSQELPLRQSASVYNPGGQDWPARYIDIDLTEQYVRMYDENGSIIWESACVSGNPNKGNSTPTGVYYLNNKATDVTLIGQTDPATGEPSYKTPVSYWMPFINNAVGLHDAPWQAAFGGTRYVDGFGSHGCVNLPSDAAASLYGLMQVGDVVVVHA